MKEMEDLRLDDPEMCRLIEDEEKRQKEKCVLSNGFRELGSQEPTECAARFRSKFIDFNTGDGAFLQINEQSGNAQQISDHLTEQRLMAGNQHFFSLLMNANILPHFFRR